MFLDLEKSVQVILRFTASKFAACLDPTGTWNLVDENQPSPWHQTADSHFADRQPLFAGYPEPCDLNILGVQDLSHGFCCKICTKISQNFPRFLQMSNLNNLGATTCTTWCHATLRVNPPLYLGARLFMEHSSA